jgi:hypothetical protein
MARTQQPGRGKPDRRISGGLTREEMAKRNALIMQMFYSGRTEVSIANSAQVGLSQPRVHEIIVKGLAADSKAQELLTAQSLTIYTARLEFLMSRAWQKIVEGDLKAIEVGRRLLEQQARLYGLVEERAPSFPIPPVSDEELMDESSPAFNALDDLTKYRIRQRKRAEGTL